MTNYAYDFNYSINFDALRSSTALALQGKTEEQRQFMLLAEQMAEAEVCKAKDMQQFALLLSKQGFFIKMGNILTNISEIQLHLVEKNMKANQILQEWRVELCDCLREMSELLFREREFHTNVVVLLLSLILARLLNQRYGLGIDRPVLFHLLHWQIKGQHSTTSFHDSLTKDILNTVHSNAFLSGKISHTKNELQKSIALKNVQSSVSFKKDGQMNSSFAMAFHKQNQQLNNQLKPSIKNFKKQMQTVAEETCGPRLLTTFAHYIKK